MTHKPVIPAQAGIQQDKNAFCLNPLDSRLRGNDVASVLFSNFILDDAALSSIMETSIDETTSQLTKLANDAN